MLTMTVVVDLVVVVVDLVVAVVVYLVALVAEALVVDLVVDLVVESWRRPQRPCGNGAMETGDGTQVVHTMAPDAD